MFNENKFNHLPFIENHPLWQDRIPNCDKNHKKQIDEYAIYHTDDVSKFLNKFVWRNGNTCLYCYKECDEKTSNCLYGNKYNPISFHVAKLISKRKGNSDRIWSKTEICSIDDSDLCVEHYFDTIEEAEDWILYLIDYVNKNKIMNFWKYETYANDYFKNEKEIK